MGSVATILFFSIHYCPIPMHKQQGDPLGQEQNSASTNTDQVSDEQRTGERVI